MARSTDFESSLELWGGIECTLNRVGDDYIDQLLLSGHSGRADDIDRFAALGLRTLRYPVLWEHVSPDGVSEDWTLPDERLAMLRERDIDVVAGLVHHGSGPRDTSLLDPAFPERLAAYAARVASRYPWIGRFTPVNEPLTTARFSGLYGHWYPHARNDQAFVRMLLNQCRATILAMRAIRGANPDARLVQTEDLGFTRSDARLQYQADFENERRFLSLDLLTGNVGDSHPLRRYLLRSGASERELAWFQENRCPPDILGMNYYVTSERFLDSRVHLHAPHVIGGNRRDAYADVEAVRICGEGLAGPASILAAAWQRYGLPMAVTEAHLGGTPDQQMSWLLYVWKEVLAARRCGADVRAVTTWALLGSFGWSNLVRTKDRDDYEAGVFELREGAVHETPLTGLVSALCRSGAPPPEAPAAGWWESPERLLHMAQGSSSRAA